MNSYFVEILHYDNLLELNHADSCWREVILWLKLKLYSLLRRRERYVITYICNITQHMVQNIHGTKWREIKTMQKPPNTWNSVL